MDRSRDWLRITRTQLKFKSFVQDFRKESQLELVRIVANRLIWLNQLIII